MKEVKWLEHQFLEKTLILDKETARILADGLLEGHYYKLELIPCGWSSPSFRLVQTKDWEAADIPLRDEESGVTIYSSEFVSQFFQDLEIFPSRVMDDGSLVIRDKRY